MAEHITIRVEATTTLAFRVLCYVASAPRFWLGVCVGSFPGALRVVLEWTGVLA